MQNFNDQLLLNITTHHRVETTMFFSCWLDNVPLDAVTPNGSVWETTLRQ